MQGRLFHERLGRVIAVAAVILSTGCSKQVRGPTTPGGEEPREVFAFSQVKVAYAAPMLRVAYTVSNHGTKRNRGGACLEVLDKDGFLIERLNPGDFSLRPGDVDTLEEEVALDARYWAEARVLRLYAGKHVGCITSSEDARSPLLHLGLNGEPLPAGTPAPPVMPEPDFPEEGKPPVFSIAGVELTQERASGVVTVAYKVTNISERRAAGSLCVRLYDAGGCQSIEDSATGDFNLAPGASEQVSTQLVIPDDSVWERVRQLKLYVAQYGCAQQVERAESAVLTLDKPTSFRGPPTFVPDPPAQAAGAQDASTRNARD